MASDRAHGTGARLPEGVVDADVGEDLDRGPLPPGHHDNRGRIIMGACLEGTIYRRLEHNLGPSRKRKQQVNNA